MIEVKDLLSKWSNVLTSGTAQREAVRRAVSEVLKKEIAPEEVEIQGSTVYLRLKPIYKNEIFLKQEKISARIGELLLGKGTDLEIR